MTEKLMMLGCLVLCTLSARAQQEAAQRSKCGPATPVEFLDQVAPHVEAGSPQVRWSIVVLSTAMGATAKARLSTIASKSKQPAIKAFWKRAIERIDRSRMHPGVGERWGIAATVDKLWIDADEIALCANLDLVQVMKLEPLLQDYVRDYQRLVRTAMEFEPRDLISYLMVQEALHEPIAQKYRKKLGRFLRSEQNEAVEGVLKNVLREVSSIRIGGERSITFWFRDVTIEPDGTIRIVKP